MYYKKTEVATNGHIWIDSSSYWCSIVQESHLHSPSEDLMWPWPTDSYQSHISVSERPWNGAVTRKSCPSTECPSVGFFFLYMVKHTCKCDLVGIEKWLSILLENPVSSAEDEVTGSGWKHQNNKREADWSLWTVLDSPLLFSIFPPPSLSTTAQHRERRWWWAPSFPSRPPLLVTLNGCLFQNISISHHHPINPMPP